MGKLYAFVAALPNPRTAPKLVFGKAASTTGWICAVSRDYEPTPGQWYENLEEEEQFHVLTVDEDSELIEIEYLDGDIEELDLEAWREMDLERIAEPEGWSDEEDSEDDEDWDEEEDEDDDDFDEDEEDGDEEQDEY